MILKNIFSFLAYPLFLFHRQYLRRCSPAVQHVFFAISGMVLANWSIGTECLMHSCAMIGVTWATLKVFQGSMPSTIFLYIFNVRNPCKNVISIFYTLKPKRLNELLIFKHLLDIDIILDIFSMPSIIW